MTTKALARITTGLRAFVAWTAVLAYAASANIAAAADANHPFVVFDGLLYTHKPDLSALGMREFRGSGNLWRPNMPLDRVDYAGTQAIVRYLRSLSDTFYLDIEQWPLLGVPDEQVERNIANLIAVADIARRTSPTAKFGIYGVLPQITYWPIALDDAAALSSWRASNERVAPLANYVDFILPSLYTYYDDRAGWEKYAAEMLKEAHRYGKPVYAFIWPEFHDSNARLRDRNLSVAFWRFQLDYCRQHADGIVIWGGPGKRWDENAPWWIETKEFLKTLKP